MRRLDRVLDRRSSVYAACAATLAIGLFFIFVWAPHPWGHEGIDHYHQLALAVAAGGTFPTLEVPWGYAYFLGLFYRLFGDHPAIPLVAQAIANAGVPWLVYDFGRRWLERPIAIAAALETGMLSFNTVYASTQTSDAMCTVIFLTAIVAYAKGRQDGDWRWYSLAGVLAGLAPQFRPNLIVVAVLLAAHALVTERSRRGAAHAATLLVCWALVQAPWIVRNYHLTRMFLPTSVHSGVQLWYGTLQMGPYLNSRAYNPRTIFETPAFEYTSLDQVPIIVTAQAGECGPGRLTEASVVYWTDRDRTERSAGAIVDHRTLTFQVPPPAAPAVLYYYLTATWVSETQPLVQTTPDRAAAAPLVYFISHNHLGDLDVHGDRLDSFDLVRMMRHAAWGEPLPFSKKLEAAGIGDRELESAVRALLQRFEWPTNAAQPLVSDFTHDEGAARLTLSDGSTLVVPRAWRGRITDLEFIGTIASALIPSSVPFERRPPQRARERPPLDACALLNEIAVNDVFYRREPHWMRRYTALALDNIARAPANFARASLYRALRLFVIRGSTDRFTAVQFGRARRVYALATAASVAYLTLFVAGTAMAWRRGYAIGLPLLLILSVPVTIAPVLTNMRYTVTIQPLLFMFIAVALTGILERAGLLARRPAARSRAGT